MVNKCVNILQTLNTGDLCNCLCMCHLICWVSVLSKGLNLLAFPLSFCVLWASCAVVTITSASVPALLECMQGALGVNTSIFAFSFVVCNFLASAMTPLVAASLASGDKDQVQTCCTYPLLPFLFASSCEIWYERTYVTCLSHPEITIVNLF